MRVSHNFIPNDIVTIMCKPLFLTDGVHAHAHKMLVFPLFILLCICPLRLLLFLYFAFLALPARGGDRTRTRRVRECISCECIREVVSSKSDVERRRRRRRNALRNSADKRVAIYGRRPYYAQRRSVHRARSFIIF